MGEALSKRMMSVEGLPLEVSAENGFGEETMSSFIQSYLASILQPFADNVDALHRAVERLDSRLVAEVQKTSSYPGQIQENALLTKQLTAELEKTNQHAGSAKVSHETALDELAKQISELRPPLMKVENDLAALDDRHRLTHTAVLDLQNEFNGTRLTIERLGLELGQVDEKLGQRVTADFKRLEANMANLERAQQATLQTLSKLEKQGAKNHDDLETFAEGHRRQRRKDEKSFKDLGIATSTLNNKLEQTDARAKSHVAGTEVLKTDIETLQRRLEQTMRMQTVQETQHKDFKAKFPAYEERLELLKASIQNVMESLGLVEGAANLVETVQKLTSAISSHGVSLQELRQASEHHDTEIEQTRQRVDPLEKIEAKLEKADRQIEERLSTRLDALEELLYQNEKDDKTERDKIESEIAARARAHAQYMAKFDQQAQENVKVSEILQKLEGNIDKTDVRVHTLEGKAALTEEKVSKLGGSMDLTQEYWKGLTKGFQETHRKVTVEKDLLPVKTPRAELDHESIPQRGNMLPALTKTV